MGRDAHLPEDELKVTDLDLDDSFDFLYRHSSQAGGSYLQVGPRSSYACSSLGIHMAGESVYMCHPAGRRLWRMQSSTLI
jgi:hypothetical protein